ncbi:hypothetical protein LP419_02885 [Massilia sp. H-1]|nr:hypothetical protein LP419_02885 [Massilia sp. H-1]
MVTSRISVRNFLRNHISQRLSKRPCGGDLRQPAEAGAQLALAMRTSHEYRPVCFFDEKHVLNERTIDGLRVFHTDRLIEMVNSLCIRSIIIAIPAVSPERLRDIMQRLAAAKRDNQDPEPPAGPGRRARADRIDPRAGSSKTCSGAHRCRRAPTCSRAACIKRRCW